MKNYLSISLRTLLTCCLITLITDGFAQRMEWKADALVYMDNQRFDIAPMATNDAFLGVRISPEIGLSWDKGTHRFMVGTHLQKDFTTKRFLDYYHFTAYYELRTKQKNIQNRLLFGSFPRKNLLKNYSGLFFGDAVHYFRPNMNGLFWQLGGKNNHINVWVDWVGMTDFNYKDNFLIGLSGEQQWKWLFIDLQAYSYFYYQQEGLPKPVLEQDLQAKASIGIDFSNAFKQLKQMRFSVGAMGGYQQTSGNFSGAYYPIGLVMDLHAEFWYVGTRTTFYYGKPFYQAYDHQRIQWANPFLYGPLYLETQWYVPIFRNQLINAEASATFHIANGKCYYQQQMSLSINLDRDKLPLKNHFSKRKKQKKASSTDVEE